MRAIRSLAALVFAGIAPLAAQQADRSALLAQIDSIVQAEMARSKTPGMSVAVERKGELLLARGYGLANVELSVPATAETVYRIGSITKQFTSSSIMQLVEAGKIATSDPMTKFLPDYPVQGHTVTIQHLLTHTSGIKSYTSLGPKFWTQSRLELSDSAMLAMFKNEPFDFDPGAKWSYNNSGFYLLGVIVEKASGMPYRKYISDRLLGPLGIRNTRYCEESPIIPHRAQGYEVRNGVLVNDDPIGMNTPGAAGALCSTVLDLLQWRRALFGGEVVSRASLKEMTTPAHLNDGSSTHYGYGLGIGELQGHKRISHGGGINGFITQLAYYPDDDVTIAVLGNLGAAPSDQVAQNIARLVLGLGLPVVLDKPIAADERKRVAGSYDLGPATVTVREEGENLMLTGIGEPQKLKSQGDGRYIPEGNPDWVLRFSPATGTAQELMVNAGDSVLKGKRKP